MNGDFYVGARVLYTYSQPGGYNWTHVVPATIVKITAHRLTIDVPTTNGCLKRISVTPEHVRLAPETEA